MSTHLCVVHAYVSWKYQKVLFSVDFSCNRMQHSLPEEACPASPWTPPSSSGLLLSAPVTSQPSLPSSCATTQLSSYVATTCILRPSLYKLKLLITEASLYPTSFFLFRQEVNSLRQFPFISLSHLLQRVWVKTAAIMFGLKAAAIMCVKKMFTNGKMYIYFFYFFRW